MRTETTEVGEARRRVEQLLAEIPRGDELAFHEPWELRAFALAVAAYENGQYDWSEFQLALIDAIRRWDGSAESSPWRYFERWLEALETTLARAGVLDGTELGERTDTVLATPRNADHHQARREPVTIDPAR